MNTPAIVAICYNREKSLKRLLDSLSYAQYPADVRVPLIISVDKSDNEEVAKVANDFKWDFGDKEVIVRSERMGLKAHVLECTSLVEKYESIIVLEDDLYVSPMFYEYTRKALDFTKDDDRIGGISLYNHLFNVHARRSFSAIDDGFDNWYFKFASSWGQAYTLNQWLGFKTWYEANKDKAIDDVFVPLNVRGWSEKSWLKYYIAYLVDTNKYFLYPRIGFTTNFGDVGSHAVKEDTDLQTPLAGISDALYCAFSSLDQSKAVYDAYFENEKLGVSLEGEQITDDVIVDLYAGKPVADMQKVSGKRYALSSQSLPYKVVKSYGRAMRPLDANICYEVTGNDFYLYDLSKSDAAPKKEDEAYSYLYEYRGISLQQMLKIIKFRIKEKLFK